MTNTINTPVNVNAYYFAGASVRSFPREIEYDGQAITFATGLRYLVQRGQQAIKLFDMSASDGLTYRLEQQDDAWTLVGTKGTL